MKKIWILVAVILIGGCLLFLKYRNSSQTQADANRTVEVTEGPIEQTIDATGEIAPLNRVEIKPPISGRIEQILVDEGDHVRAGQTMAWMSSSDRAAILDAARAQGPEQMKKWEDIYKPTPIVAPLSGTVILKNIVLGQTVDPSSVLFAMSDRLIVAVNVDEADIGKVVAGMEARITLDAYPDQSIEGSVFQILQEGINVSNVITYIVKVSPRTIPPFFRSQMTANVQLIVKSVAKAVLIPISALRDRKNGDKFVTIWEETKEPEKRSVTTGIQNGEFIQITDGLRAGERLLISQKKYLPQQQQQQSSPFGFGGRRPGSSGGSNTQSRGH